MATQGMKNLETLHIRKIMDRIREIRERFIYSNRIPVEDVAIAETMEHLSIRDAKQLKYIHVKDGHQWGRNWGTAWFRLRIHIPKEFRDESVKLLFDLEKSESLIFRGDVPVQGLSWSREDYLLTDRARGGEANELYVEAGANARLGEFRIRTMRQPEIAILNREVWDAYWDLSALADFIDPDVHYNWLKKPYPILPDTDSRRARIIYALNRAVDVFDYGHPSREALCEQAKEVRRILKSVYACHAHDSAQCCTAMGHAHIDVAWLWPLSETVRKTGRTFANVLELMDRYPDFTFTQSQPHLYEFARDRYPALYRRIRERVKEGRWIPVGCTWVEPDCNVTGGESLVRQILFGTRFFEQEYGVRSSVLWLPDVFGYPASLPQIMKRSGIDYFFTTKISISQFTRFPYHSFYWEGIDGSQVLAHLLPNEEYSSEMEPWLIRMGENDYAEKDRCPIQMLLYGRGDGGGGPSQDHVERLSRYRDFEGLPKIESGSPEDFFCRLDRESENLPKWVGELYLELHRGTYTTQAYTKKCNRQAEFQLREVEILSSINMLFGAKYEQKRINDAWKIVLLNQFHDIIPGSSIDEVYVESDRQYAEVLKDAGEISETAFNRLAKRIDTRGDGQAVFSFNTLSWDREDIVSVPAEGLRKGASYIAVDSDGQENPVQIGADGIARFVGRVPSIGYNVFHIRKGRVDLPAIHVDSLGMENEFVRVSFDRQGRIRRIYDKSSKRDVLQTGAMGNRFILFEDKMASTGEAWDIDIFYNDKPLVIDGAFESIEIVEQGPIRSVARITRTISRSRITQDVILKANSSRIDFATMVDWGNEKDVLLKVAFPVNVRSEKARYEIQFGSIERPTHWNTPQDFARFEVPAQKWADLSEGNYGVSLLNDCKYGYDIKDNIMRLTLLRAPKVPGKTADVNKQHTFTYSLFPHAGDFSADVVKEAYELNVPIRTMKVNNSAGDLPPKMGWLSIGGSNVVIDTVKKAEDDSGIIVRLYEAHGWRGRHILETSLPVRHAFETDLMENTIEEMRLKNGKITMDIKPFEIRTLKLVP